MNNDHSTANDDATAKSEAKRSLARHTLVRGTRDTRSVQIYKYLSVAK